MNCYFSSMNKFVKTMCVVGAVTLGSMGTSFADAAAEKVLAKARWATSAQTQDLTGQLRKGAKKYPIQLFLRKNNVQFVYFVGKTENKFHLRMKEGNADLWSVKNGKWNKFDNKKLAQKIQDTDLTFQDLSLSFLYWKQSKVIKQELLKGQKCDVVRLDNPGGKGNYQIVYAWVHQRYGAIMKIAGYNKEGKLVKQFATESLMKIGKEYTLKKMSVKTYDPKTSKETGRTYLDFFQPKKNDDDL